MKTLEELKTFYETELLADLQDLEAKRKQVLRNCLLVAGITVGAALTAVILFSSIHLNPPFNIAVLLLPILFSILAIGLAGVFLTRNYKYEFKEKIIRKLIAFIEPGLSYQPQQCVSSAIFQQSSIFQHRIDRYDGEDCVSGKVGQTEIMFSEVHAEYRTTSGTGKNRRTEWHTIFKGLFFWADFNKDFIGRTVVLPDTAERLFGRFGQTLQSMAIGRDELIKLEDPEFERQFVVYGSDQIDTRYILSPALMQRICEFKQKTGTELYLSFTGSKVYVAIPRTENMFEPSYFSCVKSFERIAEYHEEVMLAVGIVDDLHLNTRIWSKT